MNWLQSNRQLEELLRRVRRSPRLSAHARRVRRFFQPRIGEVSAAQKYVVRAFHAPSRNNYVDIFVPRSTDRDLFLSDVHAASRELNQVDGELLEFLTEYLSRHSEVMNEALFENLVHWKGMRAQRSFLEGAQYLEMLARELARVGHALPDLLRIQAPELVERYTSLPDDLIRVIRINLYLRPHLVPSWVEDIAKLICEEVPSAQALRRVEVARVSVRASQQPFPTLILYFSPGDAGLAACELWKPWLRERLESQDAPAVSAEFSDAWCRGSTITEGYRLYKRNLLALGCLEQVYDASSGFAYALSSRQP